MDAAQSILKKAPPADLGKNIEGFSELLKDNPDAREALQKKYQIPFHVIEPSEEDEKPFLICRQNRVGDNKYRSPWNNKLYHPRGDSDSGNDDNKVVEVGENDEELRMLELQMNGVWEAYKNLYYGREEAVGSVYLLDTEKGAFEGVFCLQKNCPAGSWDSIHYVHADEPIELNEKEVTCNYRVESSVLTVLRCSDDEDGKYTTSADTSSYLSKEFSKVCKITPSFVSGSHIENIGDLIEENEMDIRSNLERVHIPKLREIVDDLKKSNTKPKIPAGAHPMGMMMMMGSDILKNKKKQLEDDSEIVGGDDNNNKDSSSQPANPMMGAIMGSDILKKKKKNSGGHPRIPAAAGGNPMMMNEIMGSDILKKKKLQEQDS